MHFAIGVKQPKQQRPNAVPVFVDSVARHRAQRRALMLDLDQAALSWRVNAVKRLGDDAVEASTFERTEPVVSDNPVGARRREMHDVVGSERLDEDIPTRGHGLVHQRPVVESQHVEGHERRRRFRCKTINSRFRWMDPLEQRIEVKAIAATVSNDDLAIDHTPIRKRRA